MKGIVFTLVLMLFSTGLSAQNQRFFYEYKFVPDLSEKDSVKTEMMLLDVTKNGSKYYSHKKFVADSIVNEDIQKQIRSSSGNFNVNRRNAGSVPYSVEKTYPDFKVELFQQISSDAYIVEEDQKPEWKILPEKEKIGEYEAQKAETDFGGRKWTAWFTPEIPIQDGPYKFYGLPGLIVKMEDQSGTHKMTLLGNKSFVPAAEQQKTESPGLVRIGMGGKPIKVSEKQFRKLWKEYVSDPGKSMREMMMRAGGGTTVQIRFKGPDGKEITDNQQAIRAIEESAKASIKKNNNPIEPELYQ